MAPTTKDTLRKLRNVAAQLEHTQSLRRRRDELVRKAAAEGYSQRRIAIAARVSQTLVNRIVNTR